MNKMRISMKRQKQIQELMNTITELKNSLERINRLDQAEGKVSKLEDKSFEIIKSEE